MQLRLSSVVLSSLARARELFSWSLVLVVLALCGTSLWASDGGEPAAPAIPAGVAVTSNAGAVRIEASIPDQSGHTFGITPAYFAFAPGQAATLTAPLQVDNGGDWYYRFAGWYCGGVAQPALVRTINVSTVFTSLEVYAYYEYVPKLILTVNTVGGQLFGFQCSVPDLYGRTYGTRFEFRHGTVVQLTAPMGEGGVVFEQWLNPLAPPQQRSILVQVYGAVSVTAGTRVVQHGFGEGCAGSVGTPGIVPNSRAVAGRNFGITLSNLPTSGGGCAGFLITGFSCTSIHGMPLPLALDSFGWSGCQLLVSAHFLQVFFGQYGSASIVRGPVAASMLGVTFYDQVLVADPASSNGVAMSRGQATTVSRW